MENETMTNVQIGDNCDKKIESTKDNNCRNYFISKLFDFLNNLLSALVTCWVKFWVWFFETLDKFWNRFFAIVLLIVAMAYGISPIDLIPDVLVPIGFVDDGSVGLAALFNLYQQFKK